MKVKSLVLSLALLGLPGAAAAQSSVQALYFVFKLGTTLPLTVQDTPECAAEQLGWERAAASPTTSALAASGPPLRTYSFVSSLSSAALGLALDGFAREHGFATASPTGPGQQTGRQFTDAAVSGFSYATRIHLRPEAPRPGLRSVLCVTVFAPASPAQTEAAPPADDARRD